MDVGLGRRNTGPDGGRDVLVAVPISGSTFSSVGVRCFGGRFPFRAGRETTGGKGGAPVRNCSRYQRSGQHGGRKVNQEADRPHAP